MRKKNDISAYAVPIIELYYSKCQFFLAFGTYDVGEFLEFDVPNADIWHT